MIRKGAIGLAVVSLLCSLLWSCEQERDPCLLPTAVNLRVRCLQAVNDTTAVDTALANMNLAAVDNDTLKFLYLGADDAGSFNIRLSSVNDSSMFLVQPDSAFSPIDTIVFRYSRSLKFLSNACGYTYFFNLDSIHTTHHNIDSIRILNRNVTNDVNTTPPEHVQIFF